MKRIRISGSNTFDHANIFCARCNKAIIIDGDPKTPIYYKHDGFQYCSNCGNNWSYKHNKFYRRKT